MVVAPGRGRERVDGRMRPGKEVKRTLTVDEAMLKSLRIFRKIGAVSS
jgi:hypothetical protein